MSDNTYIKEFSIFISTTPVVNKIVLSLDDTIKELSTYFNNCGAEWDGDLHKKLGLFVDEFAELEIGKCARIELLNNEWASVTRCFPSFAEMEEKALHQKVQIEKFLSTNGYTEPYIGIANASAKAAIDLKLFGEIQQDLLETKTPMEGEFVEYEDGKFARISRLRGQLQLQLSNKIGVYVSKNGCSQASGCTWDSDLDHIEKSRLEVENLMPTNSTKKGRCWTFSEGIVGGGRGVYFEIDFKIWKLKK